LRFSKIRVVCPKADDGNSIHHSGKFPLIRGPGKVPGRRDANERVAAVETNLLGAGALRLVAREIVRPADDGGSPHAVDDVNVVGVVGVELFDVAELPGAEHFADGVVDALLVGKNGGGRGIRRGVVLFFFFCAEAVEARDRLRIKKNEKKKARRAAVLIVKESFRNFMLDSLPSLRRASVADGRSGAVMTVVPDSREHSAA